MIVYFSGTGNSRFAAEFLAKQLDDDLLDAGRRIKTGERDAHIPTVPGFSPRLFMPGGWQMLWRSISVVQN